MGYLGEFEQLILFSVVELGDDAYGGAIETIERRTGRVVSAGAINTALGRMRYALLNLRRMIDESKKKQPAETQVL